MHELTMNTPPFMLVVTSCIVSVVLFGLMLLLQSNKSSWNTVTFQKWFRRIAIIQIFITLMTLLSYQGMGTLVGVIGWGLIIAAPIYLIKKYA